MLEDMIKNITLGLTHNFRPGLIIFLFKLDQSTFEILNGLHKCGIRKNKNHFGRQLKQKFFEKGM